MGRKKRGQTPTYRYRITHPVAEELARIRDELDKDWNTVFQNLIERWRENKCRTEIISVGQKKKSITYSGEGKQVMDAFYEFNKGVNFKNQTFWKAADWLIREYGLDRVLNVVRFCGQIRGMPYAPRISNPYQLKEKWSDLESFALTEKQKRIPKFVDLSHL